MNIQLSKLTFAMLLPAIISFGWSEITAQSRPNTENQKLPERSKPKVPPDRPRKFLRNPVLSPQEVPSRSSIWPNRLSVGRGQRGQSQAADGDPLGLAQNAVSIVEFPASDGIYYIHEGNPACLGLSITYEGNRPADNCLSRRIVSASQRRQYGFRDKPPNAIRTCVDT